MVCVLVDVSCVSFSFSLSRQSFHLYIIIKQNNFPNSLSGPTERSAISHRLHELQPHHMIANSISLTDILENDFIIQLKKAVSFAILHDMIIIHRCRYQGPLAPTNRRTQGTVNNEKMDFLMKYTTNLDEGLVNS